MTINEKKKEKDLKQSSQPTLEMSLFKMNNPSGFTSLYTLELLESYNVYK